MNERRLTVLHIITGLDNGGAEGVLFRLCTQEAESCHIVVSLMGEGKYGPLLRAAGVEVHCLRLSRGRITLKALAQLWRLLRDKRPGVVQTWMYHADLIGGLLSKAAGVRRIFWGIRHTNLEPGKSRSRTIAVARLCAFLSRWVPTRIVCCAESARDIHRDLGYVSDKFVVISNGYDLTRFRPDPVAYQHFRIEWGIKAETPLLGMVGRFNPQKDHENLLRALDALQRRGRDFRCVLVGPEMDRANKTLAAWLERYGLTNQVLPLGQRMDIPDIMSALDVHVLSSSFGEAFPNVLAEAMACGTPCVTTSVGDAALIVGETGWVVPPGDSAALARALEKALDLWRQPADWPARQQAARQRIVDHFSIEKMVEAYHSVWAL